MIDTMTRKHDTDIITMQAGELMTGLDVKSKELQVKDTSMKGMADMLAESRDAFSKKEQEARQFKAGSEGARPVLLVTCLMLDKTLFETSLHCVGLLQLPVSPWYLAI